MAEPSSAIPDHLRNPPREFSVPPFWFWNDELSEAEILRQIADFQSHGVFGFVIHPRMGLPRSIGWMSEALLHFMSIAIEEAARRDMRVILYDEGMYPSGSSSGQVVAADASLACRCLALLPDGTEPPPDANLIARVCRVNGEQVTVIDRKADSVIRGLHYIDESTAEEDLPPAGDILNPKTAAMILHLVYDRFYDRFGPHFGKTIIGIFTDEPNPLGRLRENDVAAGTTGILPVASELLGYDFTPHLPALWFDDEPDAARYRADYSWAIHRRLERTWYQPLSEWCQSHGVALCGHPDRGDEIGVQRYFQIPGQDLVWRWVLPDHPTAVEGPESTQGKCSSSAMLHHNRRRNSNEFCGAYGHETTFEEFKWLGDWCLIRGVNLLIPHAFYYSTRGPRRDERPPQVGGVGCTWWDQFKPLADHWRRLCWLNTDSQHICSIAILTPPDHCPWTAAKICFEHQRDFNYLDTTQLKEAIVDANGLHLAGMCYSVVIIDGPCELSDANGIILAALARTGRVMAYRCSPAIDDVRAISDPQQLTAALDRCSPCDVKVDPHCPGLRIRHVVKDGHHYYLFFNETSPPISAAVHLPTTATAFWIDTAAGESVSAKTPLRLELAAYHMALLDFCDASATKTF